MKSPTLSRLLRGTAAFAACLLGLAVTARAGERVGTYDSRIVAYACFWTPDAQAAQQALIKEARAAKQSGDTARFQKLEQQIKDGQKELHLQVFSTAPCPDALAKLQDRVATVRTEAGLARLVSKWDDDALKAIPEADRVDVTEQLVRDLPLTEKQRTVMRELATKEPMPLWKAKLLAAAGKL